MASRAIRLKDIAARVGVSPMAVSYALRGAPNVSADTRERILRIAAKMGYVADPAVSRMMSHLAARKGRRVFQNTIALINPSLNERFIEEEAPLRLFETHARLRAAELGYRLERFWYHEPGVSPERLRGILQARGIEGVILSSSGRANTRLAFDFASFAFVAVGETIADPKINRVVEYHFNNGLTALRELEALGYTRIGFVFNKDVQEMHAMRHKAVALCHLDSLPAKRRVPIFEYDAWRDDAFMTWYRKFRPDVIVSNRNRAFEALGRAGVAVPDDVGFAQLELCAEREALAGIETRFNVLGRAAVELLVGQLHSREVGLPDVPKVLKIEGVWTAGPTVRRVGR